MGKGLMRGYVNSGVQPGCKSPRFKPGGAKRLPVVHGCGQCEECVKQRVSRQAGQHVLELSQYGGRGVSLGLTFRDAMLSDEQREPDWWKAEIKNAKRRLARALGVRDGAGVRLWWQAEVGETTLRQHAHVALPGVSVPAGMHRPDWWPFGHVQAQAYDKGTAYYLAGYIGDPAKRKLLIAKGHSRNYGEAAFRQLVERQKRRDAGENLGASGDEITGRGFMFDWSYYAMTARFREIAREEGIINRLDAEDLIAAWERYADEKGNADGWSKRLALKAQDLKRGQRKREMDASRDLSQPLMDGMPVRRYLRR